MKNKEVMIALRSIQSSGKNKEEMELITKGNYRKTSDGFVISYDESEATGFVGSKTILTTIGERQVTMQRKGSTVSNLVIEKEKKHHCHYGTPYGDFMMGITANDIKSNLDSSGGELYFKYVIDINSSFISDQEIFINVK